MFITRDLSYGRSELDPECGRGFHGVASRSTAHWRARSFPPVNIFRQGEDFVAVAELPGIDRSELDIQVLDNRIRVAGKRSIAYDENHSVHRRERLGGQFDRTFDLPVQIDVENVKAEFRDGILAIHLPRAESDKPRSVPIA